MGEMLIRNRIGKAYWSYFWVDVSLNSNDLLNLCYSPPVVEAVFKDLFAVKNQTKEI